MRIGLNKIAKDLFSERLEKLGFQVYINGYWYKIENGMVGMFGFPQLHQGMINIDFSMQPLVFRFDYGSSEWTGFLPKTIKIYKKYKQMKNAMDTYKELLGTPYEYEARAEFEKYLVEIFDNIVEPFFLNCKDVCSCVNEIRKLYALTNHRFAYYVAVCDPEFVIEHGMFGEFEEGQRIIDECKAFYWSHIYDSFDYDSKKDGSACRAIREGLFRSTSAEKLPNSILELLQQDTPQMKDSIREIYFILRMIDGQGKRFKDAEQIFRNHDVEACKVMAREIYLENLNVLGSRWPKEKRYLLPTEMDFERIWASGLRE